MADTVNRQVGLYPKLSESLLGKDPFGIEEQRRQLIANRASIMKKMEEYCTESWCPMWDRVHTPDGNNTVDSMVTSLLVFVYNTIAAILQAAIDMIYSTVKALLLALLIAVAAAVTITEDLMIMACWLAYLAKGLVTHVEYDHVVEQCCGRSLFLESIIRIIKANCGPYLNLIRQAVKLYYSLIQLYEEFTYKCACASGDDKQATAGMTKEEVEAYYKEKYPDNYVVVIDGAQPDYAQMAIDQTKQPNKNLMYIKMKSHTGYSGGWWFKKSLDLLVSMYNIVPDDGSDCAIRSLTKALQFISWKAFAMSPISQMSGPSSQKLYTQEQREGMRAYAKKVCPKRLWDYMVKEMRLNDNVPL